MAATGVSVFLVGFNPVSRRDRTSSLTRLTKRNRNSSLTWRLAVSAEHESVATRAETFIHFHVQDGTFGKKEGEEKSANLNAIPEKKPEKDVREEGEDRESLKDYLEKIRDLIRSNGGPPRWFSPLERGSHPADAPLLLFLPGIDGTGLGLALQHQRLGKMFDVWCLHIPVKDRTSFSGLVKFVEKKVKAQHRSSPTRPIYIVGESLGACLALAVAARNPDIDLVLIIANPATSFSKSQLKSLTPLLKVIPDQFPLNIPYMLSLMKGDPLKMLMDNVVKGIPLQQTIGQLSHNFVALSSHLSVLVETLPKETLQWKLQILESASAYANSRLCSVKAQTLILCSERDQLLPSQEEGQRLHHALPKSVIRRFDGRSHFLFLEDGVDLVTIIKGCSFYRRGKYLDYVLDYIPPTPFECKIPCERFRWLSVATSPVMLSTLEDGKVVRGLAGIPMEGPVLYVGYHMLFGIDPIPLVVELLGQRNILVRGLSHPMFFKRLKDGFLPDLSTFDSFRLMGAVPVSAPNFYGLLSSKSHVLLYPGGAREAFHRKGEAYKLFWPEKAEFVRMAAKFGAKIVPFGTVGEDDFSEILFDLDDQMKIPFFKEAVEKLTDESERLRTDANGEVANQLMQPPWVLPKVPGRLYFYFGRPIETQGMEQELRNREKCQELYLHVKAEVERCIDYLKQKREEDPYRSLLPRLLYQAIHGSTSEIPSFEP